MEDETTRPTGSDTEPVLPTPYTRRPDTKAEILKYRLALASVPLVLLILLFIIFNDTISNGQCSFGEFITFQCNRFDAVFKPWE